MKKCGCGKTPTELYITDAGQGGKWAMVSGVCCGEWMVEFKTQYNGLRSDECMALAIESWDDAPRPTHDELIQNVIDAATVYFDESYPPEAECDLERYNKLKDALAKVK